MTFDTQGIMLADRAQIMLIMALCDAAANEVFLLFPAGGVLMIPDSAAHFPKEEAVTWCSYQYSISIPSGHLIFPLCIFTTDHPDKIL